MCAGDGLRAERCDISGLVNANLSKRINPSPAPAENPHINWLDGIRGLSAFWVLAFHVQILCGMPFIPLLSYGHLAVDLFMMMSGFLMVHHYALRRSIEPWPAPSTWVTFWIRRFFRVAPLYFLLLGVALSLAPWLGELRHELAQTWPQASTPSNRYSEVGFMKLLTHYLLVFGFLPQYSFSTPLPDWSIGLEIQFYLAFPILMVLIERYGFLKTGFFLTALGIFSVHAFSDYFEAFPLPSTLPQKFYMFYCGMMVAAARWKMTSARNALIFCFTSCCYYAIEEMRLDSACRILVAFQFFYFALGEDFVSSTSSNRYLLMLRKMFSTKMAVFSGETSYGVYLVHLLFLIPLAGTLSGFDFYQTMPAINRFLITLIMTAVPSYFSAWLLYQWVEKPGIQLGKRLIKIKRALPVPAA